MIRIILALVCFKSRLFSQLLSVHESQSLEIFAENIDCWLSLVNICEAEHSNVHANIHEEIVFSLNHHVCIFHLIKIPSHTHNQLDMCMLHTYTLISQTIHIYVKNVNAIFCLNQSLLSNHLHIVRYNFIPMAIEFLIS